MSKRSSRFIAVCPNCLVQVKVNSEWNGQMVRCNFCKHKFEAVAPEEWPGEPSGEAEPAAPAPVEQTEKSASERISLLCPHCTTRLSVRSAHMGHHVRCSGCQTKFLLPKILSSTRQAMLQKEEVQLLNQLQNKLQQSHDDFVADQKSSPISEQEIDSVRGVLGRVLAEFNTLRNDRVRIRRERNHVGARYQKLRAKYEALKAERVRNRQELERLDAEMNGVRAALGEVRPEEAGILKQAHEAVVLERDEVLAELRRLRESVAAEVGDLERTQQALLLERDEAIAELGRLRDERSRLHSEHERLGNERQQRLAELDERHRAAADEMAGLREGFETLRRERDELEAALNRLRESQSGELRGLREGHDALRRERDELVAALKILREQNVAILAERDEVGAELGRLRDERSRLLAEHEQWGQDQRRQLAELDERHRVAADEVGGLRLVHETLHRERDELEAALNGLRESHASELHGLREAHEGLLAEAAGLRERLQSLQGELSDREGLAELHSRRERDLESGREIEAQLRERLQRVETSLHESQNDRAELTRNLESERQQLEVVRSQRDQLHERVTGGDQSLQSSREEFEVLTRQFQAREEELKARQAELARQGEELRALQAQNEGATSRLKALETANLELQGTIQQLRTELSTAIQNEAPRATTASQSASKNSRPSPHEDALAEAIAAIEIKTGRGIRPEEGNVPRVVSPPEPDGPSSEELEAAQEELKSLRRQLADQETYARSLASMLAGIGIRAPAPKRR